MNCNKKHQAQTNSINIELYQYWSSSFIRNSHRDKPGAVGIAPIHTQIHSGTGGHNDNAGFTSPDIGRRHFNLSDGDVGQPGMNPADKWYFDWLFNGRQLKRGDGWECTADQQVLHEDEAFLRNRNRYESFFIGFEKGSCSKTKWKGWWWRR